MPLKMNTSQEVSHYIIFSYTQWDNKCFGINDIEAKEIDPQQRYVLECVHMALEDGGLTRKSIKGSETGVFIGNFNNKPNICMYI